MAERNTKPRDGGTVKCVPNPAGASRPFASALLACLLTVAWLLVPALHAAPARAAPDAPRLGILASGDGGEYREVVDAFERHLGDLAAHTLVMTLGTETATVDALRDADIVVTVGTRAARAAQGLPDTIPILSVYIPKDAFAALDAAAAPRRRVHAIYLDQPFDRQFRYIRELLPEARVVGLPIGAGVELPAAAEQAATAFGFQLHVIRAATGPEVVSQLRRAIESGDAVLLVPDGELLTSERAKWLLYMAYQRRKPVFGFSQRFVDAGALGAVYSTPAQIGRDAAERVRELWKNGSRGRADPYPRYFLAEYNPFIARSLGVPLSAARSGSGSTGEGAP